MAQTSALNQVFAESSMQQLGMLNVMTSFLLAECEVKMREGWYMIWPHPHHDALLQSHSSWQLPTVASYLPTAACLFL